MGGASPVLVQFSAVQAVVNDDALCLCVLLRPAPAGAHEIVRSQVVQRQHMHVGVELVIVLVDKPDMREQARFIGDEQVVRVL